MTNRDWLFGLPLEDQIAWMNAEHEDGGADTCRYTDDESIFMLTCDCCGHGMTYRPRYCPNCGRKEVGA